MDKLLQNGFRLVAVIAITLSLVFGVTNVKADTVNCAAVCDSAALTAAIAAAVDGDVIEVPAGTHPLTALVTVDKDVTIHGAGPGVTIFEVTGGGAGNAHRISITADGATLENLEISKIDELTPQNIIYVAANNVTLQGLTVHGMWNIGEDQVSRAIEAVGGKTGILFQNNTFYGLRQPGYLNTSQFDIKNNTVYGTKGWVLEGANVTFEGNTWGTGGDSNVVDIAILSVTNAAYYPDLMAISALNNNAVIEDQRTTPFTLTHVWVNDDATAGGNGYKLTPLQSIQAGIDKATKGGNVIIAAGTYNENANLDTNLVINKSVNLLGAGKDQTIVRMSDGKISGLEINGTDAEVSINRMGFLPQVGSVDAPEYGILFGGEVSSFASLLVNEVAVQGAAVANMMLMGTSTYGQVTIEDSDFTLGGNMGVELIGPFDYLNIARTNITDNGNATSNTGGGLYMPDATIASLDIYDSEFSRNVQFGVLAGEITKANFSRIKANGTLGGVDTAGLTIFVEDTSASNISIASSEFLDNSNAGIQLISSGDSALIDDLTIVSNRFAGNQGPAIHRWSGGTQKDIKVHHNSIVTPVDGVAIQNDDEVDTHAILAENNWFGCNAGPNQPGCGAVLGTVDANPWLVLKPVVASTNVPANSSVEITANLNFNSDDVDTTVPNRGYFPNGVSVGFTADTNTVDPASALTADGVAKTNYIAGSTLLADQVCATLDNETACINLEVVNAAPVGVNDTYNMNQMETLTVPAATGVLANDTDGNNDPFTAVLVSGPTNGVLTLNADGSFVYTASRYWSGTDTFTYKANDGTNDSAVVTVTITVAEMYNSYIFMPLINR